MERSCLDTSVLIELARRRLLRYIDPFREELYLTRLTVYEYLRGLEVLGRDVDKAKDLLEKLFYIVDFDNEAVKKASNIYSILFRKGVVIPDPDIIIASICIVNNLPIASFNQHFKRLVKLGLKLYNPSKIINELNRRADFLKKFSSS